MSMYAQVFVEICRDLQSCDFLYQENEAYPELGLLSLSGTVPSTSHRLSDYLHDGPRSGLSPHSTSEGTGLRAAAGWTWDLNTGL